MPPGAVGSHWELQVHLEHQATSTRMPTRRFKSLTCVAPTLSPDYPNNVSVELFAKDTAGVANVRFETVCWRTGTAERCSKGEAGEKKTPTPSFTRVPSASRLVRPRGRGTPVHLRAVTPSHYSLPWGAQLRGHRSASPRTKSSRRS